MTTKTEQHTPGPWEMSKGPPAGVPGRSLTNSPGWTVYAPDDLNPNGHLQVASYTYSEANARLIVAAPAMRSELSCLADDLQSFSDCDTVPDLDWIIENLSSIRDLIATAQGPTT